MAEHDALRRPLRAAGEQHHRRARPAGRRPRQPRARASASTMPRSFARRARSRRADPQARRIRFSASSRATTAIQPPLLDESRATSRWSRPPPLGRPPACPRCRRRSSASPAPARTPAARRTSPAPRSRSAASRRPARPPAPSASSRRPSTAAPITSRPSVIGTRAVSSMIASPGAMPVARMQQCREQRPVDVARREARLHHDLVQRLAERMPPRPPPQRPDRR